MQEELVELANDSDRARVGKRSVAVVGRYALAVAVLALGLWLSFEAMSVVVERAGRGPLAPGEMMWLIDHSLSTSLLHGILGIGGFRLVLGKRPFSLWMACSLLMPAYAAWRVLQ